MIIHPFTRLRFLPACSLFFFLGLTLSSCTSIITTTMIDPAVSNLQKQQDIDLVCEGAASYLLMIDSLIESDPQDKDLLLVGTKAYSGSVAALSSCDAPPSRINAISTKAKKYGKRLLNTLIKTDKLAISDSTAALDSLDRSDSEYLFWGTFGWLGWIQQQSGSPASMADLIVVEKLMAKILDLDETIENGSPHLFFGALYGAKPEMIGGDFTRSRQHFERALKISNRSFLMVQTTYAATYCRMTFNQELHDTLLREVLDYPIAQAPDNTLANQIAKRKAKSLLKDEFFD